ncbi:hypothetical protein BN12_10071 [Nostocoides japonicum T1-X7]|uniref:Uncharacterized protein n=1 Tax=Nostocoides japonicum T1-X7 TaxID=1194083 RepID=A0A077LV76_9MICO|nr:hypothetical protein BN12_10071 [Tetrasphaera japonica T1-X7]
MTNRLRHNPHPSQAVALSESVRGLEGSTLGPIGAVCATLALRKRLLVRGKDREEGAWVQQPGLAAQDLRIWPDALLGLSTSRPSNRIQEFTPAKFAGVLLDTFLKSWRDEGAGSSSSASEQSPKLLASPLQVLLVAPSMRCSRTGTSRFRRWLTTRQPPRPESAVRGHTDPPCGWGHQESREPPT